MPRDVFQRKQVLHGNGRPEGGSTPSHTEACRERFRALLKDDAKVKNAEATKRESEEREAECGIGPLGH